MAAKEMYDYLSAASADNDQNLSVNPSDIVPEEGEFSQEVHVGDDGSEERISHSTSAMFFVTLKWDVVDAADSGTIMDFYFDPAKGSGTSKTFKWTHPSDGHVYVVRFAEKFRRSPGSAGIHTVSDIRLKVLGYVS